MKTMIKSEIYHDGEYLPFSDCALAFRAIFEEDRFF